MTLHTLGPLTLFVVLAFQEPPDPRVEQALKSLSSPQPAEHQRSKMLLAELAQSPALRPIVVAALLKALNIEAPPAQEETQKAMIDTLALIGDPSAAPRLTELMESRTVYFLGFGGAQIPRRGVHAQAARALGKLGAPAAIPRLKARLADLKETWEVREAAAESLVALGKQFQDASAAAAGLLCLGRWDEAKTLPVSAFITELMENLRKSFEAHHDGAVATGLKLLSDINYRPRLEAETRQLEFYGPNYLELVRSTVPALSLLEKVAGGSERGRARLAEIRFWIGRPMPVKLLSQAAVETVGAIPGGAAVRLLNWLDQEHLCMQRWDAAFGIVAYQEVNLTSGAFAQVESPRAWLKRSRGGQAEASLWAEHAFGWDAQGRRVDKSRFELKRRREGGDWQRLALLDREPSFLDMSPEGTHIVVDADQVGSVQVFDTMGGPPRQVPSAAQACFGEASHLLYCLSTGEDRSVIRRIDLRSGAEQPVVEGFRIARMAFSSAGRYLAYTSRSTAGELLYAVRAGLSRPVLITSPGVSDSLPAMSPDGQWLMFIRTAGDGKRSFCRVDLAKLPATPEPPQPRPAPLVKKAVTTSKPATPPRR